MPVRQTFSSARQIESSAIDLTFPAAEISHKILGVTLLIQRDFLNLSP
jgi:hypothetical protein